MRSFIALYKVAALRNKNLRTDYSSLLERGGRSESNYIASALTDGKDNFRSSLDLTPNDTNAGGCQILTSPPKTTDHIDLTNNLNFWTSTLMELKLSR